MDRTLYDRDFYTWTREQAAALRQAAETRVNLPIDWEAVAEEIEDLGKAAESTLESMIQLTLQHFLYLEHSTAEAPRKGWLAEISTFRDTAHKTLRRNRGLKGRLDSVYAEAWVSARKVAARKLAIYGEAREADIPTDCPYTLDQVLDEDWYPSAVPPDDRGA